MHSLPTPQTIPRLPPPCTPSFTQIQLYQKYPALSESVTLSLTNSTMLLHIPPSLTYLANSTQSYLQAFHNAPHNYG
jgi:hypothetical protein